MSFGWSSSDILASLALSRALYDALTDSPKEFQEFKSFLELLGANLSLILSWTTDPTNQDLSFTAAETDVLKKVMSRLQTSVTRFDTTISKYMRLDQKPPSMSVIDQVKRQGDKLRWHFLTEPEVTEHKREVMGDLAQLNSIAFSHNLRSHQSLSLKLDLLSQSVSSKQDETFAVVSELHDLFAHLVLAMGEIPAARSIPLDTISTSATTGAAQHGSKIIALLAKLQPYGVESALSKGFSSSSSALHMDITANNTINGWLQSTEAVTNGSSSPSPHSLWLWGKSGRSLSKVIMYVSHDLNLPVIYYRCNRLDANGDDIGSPKILHAICYSYLYQLLGYLMTDETDTKTLALILNCDAIKQLDGTLMSTCAAVTAIQYIVDIIFSSSYRAIFVIEDFDLLLRNVDLDNDLTRASPPTHAAVLREFLAIFIHKGHIDGLQKGSSCIRTLLTTSGTTTFLIDAMQRNQITRLSTDKTIHRGRFKCSERLHALLADFKASS